MVPPAPWRCAMAGRNSIDWAPGHAARRRASLRCGPTVGSRPAAHVGENVPVNMRMLYRRHLSIVGGTGASPASVREVFAAVAAATLVPPLVFHSFPLEQIAAVHEASLGRDLFGRAVVTIGEP